MKHIIFLICALFACFNTAKAQVTISTRDLNGTKWQCLSSIYEYKNGKEIWHRKDGSSFTYQFYLSDQMPEAFDFSKVGTSIKEFGKKVWTCIKKPFSKTKKVI